MRRLGSATARRAAMASRAHKTFEVSQPPNPERQFFLPLDRAAKTIMGAEGQLTLYRGPPAVGKTTLAEEILRQAPAIRDGTLNSGGYLYISGKDVWDAPDSEQSVLDQLDAKRNLNGARSTDHRRRGLRHFSLCEFDGRGEEGALAFRKNIWGLLEARRGNSEEAEDHILWVVI